jgi:hypothetical protein
MKNAPLKNYIVSPLQGYSLANNNNYSAFNHQLNPNPDQLQMKPILLPPPLMKEQSQSIMCSATSTGGGA